MFWINVKKELKNLNKTQKWLSSKINVSYNTLKNWIANETIPDGLITFNIAQNLNVSVEKLITGKEENKKEKMKSKLKEMRNNLNDLESMI